MSRTQRIATPLLIAMLATGCSLLGGRSRPAPRPAAARPPAPAADAAARQQPASSIKPYAQVITPQMRSDSGLFTVHVSGAKLFFEIPDSLLGRDMLLISRIAAAPRDLSPFLNAGVSVAEQLVRWERHGDRVLLRRYSYERIADDTLPIARSVRANTFAPILRAFDIQAIGPDSASLVVDVTGLFTQDVPAISPLASDTRTQFQVRRLDPDRTFIDGARSFPLNVEVRHTLTFEAGRPPSDAAAGTISVLMNQSLVLLPETPMRVRYADPRVGWFTIEQVDFGSDELKAATRTIIRRWRLEPKDPEAYARGELVEPVKPIVFYLDPATPMRWRPYIRQGIEDWQKAFETAGFRNAIIAKDPPTPEEDPEFSPEDVRYSMVRYVANMTRNAMGPSVSDPRSGEIISSHVLWYHNHLRSYRNRLMIETGAANPDARSLHLPEALIGEAVRQVIAHEIGHALGLPHNMIASSAFPVDSLRSPTFTERYGVSPSIMDYARQNYVAQPGDGVTRFIRKIGPYDHYAINWGYRVIPNVKSSEDEKPFLDRWILEHAGDRMYRFGSADGIDPDAQTEDIGDDPIRASALGIENLKRVLPRLVEWTATPGEGYADLEELYGELVATWRRYLSHVITLVGGVHRTPKTADQDGVVYRPVDPARQRAAVRFLADQVFRTPTWIVDENISRRIQASGAMNAAVNAQRMVLTSLFDIGRMQRMLEAEVLDPDSAYRLETMLADVKRAVWTELESGESIDAYRRDLQRTHLSRLTELVVDDPSAPAAARTRADAAARSDIRALARAQLRELRGEAAAAARRAPDRMTRVHLEEVVARIDAALSAGAR